LASRWFRISPKTDIKQYLHVTRDVIGAIPIQDLVITLRVCSLFDTHIRSIVILLRVMFVHLQMTMATSLLSLCLRRRPPVVPVDQRPVLGGTPAGTRGELTPVRAARAAMDRSTASLRHVPSHRANDLCLRRATAARYARRVRDYLVFRFIYSFVFIRNIDYSPPCCIVFMYT